MQFLDSQNETGLEWEEFYKELTERFDLKSQSAWSIKELEAYDRYLDAFRSSEGQIETAEKRRTLALARKLLKQGKLSGAEIAEVTELSIEQVEELKNNIQL